MTDDPQTYLALIGDIRGSRELEDRAAVQQRLEAVLTDLNDRLGPVLAADLIITTGDEFQGLFLAPEALIETVIEVSDRLHPLTVAFGIGAGPLETPLKPQAVGMDGPCFHTARHALEVLAKDRDRWAAIDGFGASIERPANTILSLMGAIRQGWTPRQAEIIRTVRSAETQKAAAEVLDVSPSVVSESLSTARFRQVEEAERVLAEMLAPIPEAGP